MSSRGGCCTIAGRMRLLSYNIHKGIGGRDRRYRIERIVRVIEEREPGPDLPAGGRPARPADAARRPAGELAEAFDAAGAPLPAQRPARRSGGYGNLVLSRWPFREHAPGLAPAQAAEAARGAARGGRDARGAAPPGPLAPRPGRARAALAGRATCSSTRSSASRPTCRP